MKTLKPQAWTSNNGTVWFFKPLVGGLYLELCFYLGKLITDSTKLVTPEQVAAYKWHPTVCKKVSNCEATKTLKAYWRDNDTKGVLTTRAAVSPAYNP